MDQLKAIFGAIFAMLHKSQNGTENVEKISKPKKDNVLEKKYMISLTELIKNVKPETIPSEHIDNLNILLSKVNVIREKYGKPMVPSSGYRSLEDHLRIYKEKGITDKAKIPMKSNHLKGLAVDIFDPKQELQTWVKANIFLLEEQGLYCEDFAYTKNWVHFQCVAPASGNRFFIP